MHKPSYSIRARSTMWSSNTILSTLLDAVSLKVRASSGRRSGLRPFSELSELGSAFARCVALAFARCKDLCNSSVLLSSSSFQSPNAVRRAAFVSCTMVLGSSKKLVHKPSASATIADVDGSMAEVTNSVAGAVGFAASYASRPATVCEAIGVDGCEDNASTKDADADCFPVYDLAAVAPAIAAGIVPAGPPPITAFTSAACIGAGGSPIDRPTKPHRTRRDRDSANLASTLANF
mmetsp:Transcript_31509/g.79560  ORF Transcript_31509/g.79560 Transcript_31509/m.79560 type:complete len:235 (+) Transcript_31509:561-1265(+)